MHARVPSIRSSQCLDRNATRERGGWAGILDTLPATGPALVVLHNDFHPEARQAVAHALSPMRRDIKILVPRAQACAVNGAIPLPSRLSPRSLPLGASRWLRAGGVLLWFALDPRHPRRTDWPFWVGRLARLAQAPIWPAFLCPPGNFPPRLALGQRVRPERLKALARDGAIQEYLSIRGQLLQAQFAPRPWRKSVATRRAINTTAFQPVIPPLPVASCQAEISALPASQQLAASGDMLVYWARAEQIPNLLQELGRLREITFRATGEGTGKAVDLDEYDEYYLHLFIWESCKQELVGAYRMGQSDEILKSRGLAGLYTHGLFQFQPELLDAINPALEMGRSFIRAEYQRNASSMFLLWKGIAQFTLRHPRYWVLFGPVSTSNDYNPLSQRLMVEYLRDREFLPELAQWVHPSNPFPLDRRLNLHRGRAVGIDEISDWVARIEPDGKGVPILLKQYLRLGGKLLGFNVDPAFSNVVDGLILVDMVKTDQRVMHRYLGKEGIVKFLAHHGLPFPSNDPSP